MASAAKLTTQHIVLNAVGGFLAGYGLVAFACFLGIQQYWVDTAPTAPAPSLGAIFPHNNHGYIAYFTAFQTTSCALLFETSTPLMAIGTLIAPKKNIKSWSSFPAWRATYEQDDPRHIMKWALALGAFAAPAIVFLLGPRLVYWLIAQGLIQRF